MNFSELIALRPGRPFRPGALVGLTAAQERNYLLWRRSLRLPWSNHLPTPPRSQCYRDKDGQPAAILIRNKIHRAYELAEIFMLDCEFVTAEDVLLTGGPRAILEAFNGMDYLDQERTVRAIAHVQKSPR